MKKIHSAFTLLAALMVAASSVAAQGVSHPAPVAAGLMTKYPYSMAGQILFSSGTNDYIGSGAVVYTRSVVTAGHIVWNPDTGWSTNIEFNRAQSGLSRASRQVATRLFVFASYRSVTARFGVDSTVAFASDLGGLRFSAMPAAGAYAGWRADPAMLTGSAPKICLGYGAEIHTGNDLLAVQPQLAFLPVRGAYMENDSLTFEPGMSGGPVFTEIAPGDFRVVAVIVAGSANPPAGGVRVLDATGGAFIRTYLRY